MATDTVQLPTNFVSQMLTVSTDTLGNFAPLVYTIIGVLLAVVVVEILIAIFRK